jgi:hypothetical protein
MPRVAGPERGAQVLRARKTKDPHLLTWRGGPPRRRHRVAEALVLRPVPGSSVVDRSHTFRLKALPVVHWRSHSLKMEARAIEKVPPLHLRRAMTVLLDC